MIIKHYIVNTMNEAMTRIRYELGRDAVIISQRKIRKPGIKGFFSAKSIEVTAAVENEVNEKKQNTVNYNDNGRNSNELNNIELNSIEAIKKVVQQENENVNHSRVVQKQNNSVHKDSNQSDNNSENLMSEMMKMKTMISELSFKRELSLEKELSQVGKSMENQKSDIEEILFDNDVDSENIENIMVKIKNNKTEKTDLEKLKIILKEMIHITKPKLQGRIVLVGPTGVGKTTTIAKLAGKLALAEGKKVGLITVDTYRIGAVEQLKAYADIMNLPFKVVYNMNDMDNAIKSMSECEVVLIDTTGRSSKNKMQIAELRTFVEKADTKNIHLVLSSTTKNRDMKYIIEGYRILNYNSIIVTKLDETATYGSILNILETAKIPLSFVSVGQNVPDDIKELSADSIVSLILGEDTIC
ncbi:flagellar biosynthesis protein FlhF [Clostridium estertheticum]|uniref:flagellar biosynthesis protein FlhF n=1 Tax=Clostridium estertheticum TaxID=238834 RepID=UPI00124CF95A|nr:flagellar biosynthesis protein FlhF [Clostridium estertheticum]MBU3170170.1 flagellar biosynthesis protein FlhF [Clostridium estertheticum]MBZ9617052.1 flagellar biosynthesis protein FlhF [Clostridium estertheticum subsp. laramiense]WAG72750.1 flagellar biosynthesis protein FlhF [Clostridium estertheticum]